MTSALPYTVWSGLTVYCYQKQKHQASVISFPLALLYQKWEQTIPEFNQLWQLRKSNSPVQALSSFDKWVGYQKNSTSVLKVAVFLRAHLKIRGNGWPSTRHRLTLRWIQLYYPAGYLETWWWPRCKPFPPFQGTVMEPLETSGALHTNVFTNYI